MLKKLTRAEAHKAMDEGKVIVTHEGLKAWRDDNHEKGPYLISYKHNTPDRMEDGWDFDWHLEVEEPWRPTEGEAVYAKGSKDSDWQYSIYSHIGNSKEYPFVLSGLVSASFIAPVKGNEGSAGTTKELKNTLTAEDLK